MKWASRRVVGIGVSAVVLAGCVSAPAPVAPVSASARVNPSPAGSPSSTGPTSTGPTSTAPASSPTTTTPTPSTSATVPATPAVTVTSVANFRDVAGEGRGLRLADGTRMATGVVYRSGTITGMSRQDRNRLAGAGLQTVYDLRTPASARTSPDPVIGRARDILINVFAVDDREKADLRTAADSRRHFQTMNREFVTDPAQRRRIARTLEGIAHSTGPVLIHCVEGKDRTGWISALLQTVAGADPDTIMAQYLASNDYRAELIEARVAAVNRSYGPVRAAAVRAAQTVERSYLQAGLDAAVAGYGSVEGYLSTGLGLSGATLAELRTRLRAG